MGMRGDSCGNAGGILLTGRIGRAGSLLLPLPLESKEGVFLEKGSSQKCPYSKGQETRERNLI